jgi:hypothetical protein
MARERNTSWPVIGADCITIYEGMQRQKSEEFDKDAHFVIDFTTAPGGVLFIAKNVSALPAVPSSPKELISTISLSKAASR